MMIRLICFQFILWAFINFHCNAKPNVTNNKFQNNLLTEVPRNDQNNFQTTKKIFEFSDGHETVITVKVTSKAKTAKLNVTTPPTAKSNQQQMMTKTAIKGAKIAKMVQTNITSMSTIYMKISSATTAKVKPALKSIVTDTSKPNVNLNKTELKPTAKRKVTNNLRRNASVTTTKFMTSMQEALYTTVRPTITVAQLVKTEPKKLQIADVNKKKLSLNATKSNVLPTTKLRASQIATNLPPKATRKDTTSTMNSVTLKTTKSLSTIQKCNFESKFYEHLTTWVYNSLFNITCDNGIVKVLNCITSLGTQIPLGTYDFVEKNGYHYDCKVKRKLETLVVDTPRPQIVNEHKDNEMDYVPECDEGESYYVRANFMVSCEREEILGCVDTYGDLIRSGYYVLSHGRLRNCSLAENGHTAISQCKGCFNGSRDDDPEQKQFHVPLGGYWHSGDFILECGIQGFTVQQCQITERDQNGNDDRMFVIAGSAWIDSTNVFNVCQ